MWQKLLTGIIINVGCYLIGRKVEKYINQKEELEHKLKEQENVVKVKDAVRCLDDDDYDRLLRESTEGSAEFLFGLHTGDLHGSGSGTDSSKLDTKGNDE